MALSVHTIKWGALFASALLIQDIAASGRSQPHPSIAMHKPQVKYPCTDLHSSSLASICWMWFELLFHAVKLYKITEIT